MPGNALIGTITVAGSSAAVPVTGKFNYSLWGTWTGSVDLERSFDNGDTWVKFTDHLADTANLDVVLEEPEQGVGVAQKPVLYRVTGTGAWTGTTNFRIGNIRP